VLLNNYKKTAECSECANYCETFGDLLDRIDFGFVDLEAEQARMNEIHAKNMVN
jgi:hypothetical protein